LAKSRTLQQFSDDLKKEGATGLEKRLRGLMEALKTDVETQAKHAYIRSGLRIRSGSLFGSIAGGSLAKAEGIGLFVRAGGLDKRGQPIRYAKIHEFGGEIRAKGRMLAIPQGPAKTAARVSKAPSPLDFRGQLFLRADEKGVRLINQSTMKTWFILKSKVDIPARPYLRPGLKAVSQRMPDDLRKIVKLSIVGM